MLAEPLTTAPARRTEMSQEIERFPLTPSEWWDDNPLRVLEWTMLLSSRFAEAAIALNLKRKVLSRDNSMRVWTTLEELSLLLMQAWSQR